MSEAPENCSDLTTDAYPTPPRRNSDGDSDAGQENSDQNHRNRTSSNNSIGGNDSGFKYESNFCSGKSRTFSEETPINAFPNVINITNASGIQIGSNYTYIVNTPINSKAKSTSTQHIPKTDMINSLLSSKRIVTHNDIQFISSHMNESWMETARYLNYSNGQISQIHCDFISISLKEVIYQFLLDWIRNNGQKATVGTLADALWNTGQEECVSRWSLSN